MSGYRSDSTVEIRPFVHRREGHEVIIGDRDGDVLLAVPVEGLDILESLSAGNTIGETVREYEAKHQETPDIEAFLEALAAEGLVSQGQGRPAADAGAAPSGPADHAAGGHRHRYVARPIRTYSLDWISPAVARRLTSPPVVLACLALIAAAFGLFLSDPKLLPGPQILLFPGGSFAVLAPIAAVFGLTGTFIHELAHAVVARAEGLRVNLRISNLMFFLVAQTDISGLQMAPKRRRCLAIAAGAIADLTSAALLMFVLYANQAGAFDLPFSVALVMKVLMLAYVLRCSFQTFAYVRTDLYYLLAALFECRNLLTDTETLLKNILFRVTGLKRRVVDQSGISRRERRWIRAYVVIYLIGRVSAFATLLFILVPLLVSIVRQFVLYSVGRPTAMGLPGLVAFAILAIMVHVTGLYLWLRAIYRGHRERRALAVTQPPAPATVPAATAGS
jgi:putative peptide zinc metalloprotease protein